MTNFLRFSFITLMLVIFTSASIAGNKKNKNNSKVQEYIYTEKGMRHHLVVMNKYDEKLGKVTAGIIDTIQHAHTTDPSSWDTGMLDGYAASGDTVVNWYWFAADTAHLLEIHASFRTTGTGSWNVWSERNINTANGSLLFDVPWSIETADTNEAGEATGNWQVKDLEAEGLDADVPNGGAYIGYYFDGDGGPFIWQDDGDHPIDDATWRRAIMYISAFGGWYSWANSATWTEFVQRIVVYYEKVAPMTTIKTNIPDHFAGNPLYPSAVEAEIVDLDGTVASANLNYSIGIDGAPQAVAMSATEGDMWSADFGATFSAGDTVYYWIDATDDGGNSRESGSNSFLVVDPPAKGTSVLYVNEGGNVDDVVFTDALTNLSKDYFVWNVGDHGGISSFEINWGFDNIVWHGFGSGSLPSPFETGAHSMKDYLDGGGHLMLIDNDYLYANGFGTDTLVAGEFGYDYLGMYTGFSDPSYGDSIFYGVTADVIGGDFADPDSLVTFPDTWGTWSVSDDQYATDWQDLVVPNENGSATFYNGYLPNGYHTGIRYDNGSFATAFFVFGLETSGAADLETVLGNTLTWFGTISSLEDENYTVSEFALAQNYPNPFNPTTQIDFYLKSAQKVKIEVFNTLGQKVALLTNKEYLAGKHSVNWNSVDLKNNLVSSGIYYYKLSAGDYSSIKKMVLVK